jgi:hypothetical protein
MAQLTQKHAGQPAWHPSGDYLILQVQPLDSTVSAFSAHPGRGVGNDLFAIRFPDLATFRLTEIAGRGRGVLHPHFSNDGSALLWSEMLNPVELSKEQAIGEWVLKAATFRIADDGSVALEDLRTVNPGERVAFYENHGLSPDDSTWIFSANLDPSKRWAELNDIYVADFPSGGNLRRFTSAGYNEHALFLRDGRILWMSSAGNADRGTDYWLANADGSGLTRLTRMNENSRDLAIAADWTPGPDASSFIAYVSDGLGAMKGKIILFSGL